MTLSSINATKIGQRTVLTPLGALTYKNCEELETVFNESANQQKTDIILDCKDVSYLDSKALELMVQMHEALKNQGSILQIISLNALCNDILLVTRLAHTFNVYKNIHEAIKNTS
ncbi:MAG: STAS domain-containing protein [Desulfobacterales bacterium]|nr:STAS domain-containing protein [Desulfobacterales bacterium]